MEKKKEKETSLNEESSKEKEPSSTHEKERKRTEKEKKGIREPVKKKNCKPFIYSHLLILFKKVPLKDRIKRKRRHKPIWNVYPTVSLNDPMTNSHRKFPTNQINTTKYNIWTFLPKNLFEQFRRATNVTNLQTDLLLITIYINIVLFFDSYNYYFNSPSESFNSHYEHSSIIFCLGSYCN